ncbi:MAG: CCA tRNA nucleotidyltransferase [Nitrosopumilales archaeon CG_4_10_14_0_8_um_filter_34_8]|nr:MAG: CCA tRNA nucleotidyltransferase [Nitrosopumilales archaeon CG_4_10_14_0_8_um_filter_34_8]PJB98250.1 MAG: CCA tRNA nucleotidyltransferase [Nitrosopumilales archaeon CG_4_9_14_0_8_um_filter_34_10]
MKQILSKIRKSVILSKNVKKLKKQIADEAYLLVENQIKNYPEITGLEFGGSYAKDTWLSKEADIDIFIKFKKTVSDEKFTEITKKVGFESLKKYNPYVRYSEHPYVEARIKKTKINVVPCYEVNLGEWKSSADRSPFHTKHMQKSLTTKMRNEVRILKTFLKVNKIYGAEIAKQGFSGYVSEVLILNFNNFENVIKSIAQIQQGQIIGKTSKVFETAIVIIDPIDSNRNLAAAISNENIGKFILLCRAFENKPNLEFFNQKKLKLSKNNWENVLVVKFNFKMRSPDIIWGQIKKATTSLATQLQLGGFNVLRSKAYSDERGKAYFFFLLESTKIPINYSKSGPDFFRVSDCNSFISKNIVKTELMWINDDGEIIALEKRRQNEVVKFMTELLKNNLQTGVPKGLQNDFKKGVKITVGNKNLSKSIKEAILDLISTDDSIFHSN